MRTIPSSAMQTMALAAALAVAACGGDDTQSMLSATTPDADPNAGAPGGPVPAPNMPPGGPGVITPPGMDPVTTLPGPDTPTPTPTDGPDDMMVDAGPVDVDAGGPDAGSDRRPPATSLSFPTMIVKVDDEPVFHVTRPSDLDEPGALLPVVVWANGGCFRSDFSWQPLFDRWASAGFVVLSLTGTGGDDDIFGMLQSTTKVEHAQLIDWVVKQNESGPYAGKLDLSRIVAAGNSCGGVTALQTAADEDRLAAVFVLSGSSAIGSVDTQVMKAISVPVGYVVGDDTDIAAANAAGDYAALNDGVPGMIVRRFEGDHVTVSTDAMIAPEVAEIALNFMDLALYGSQEAYDALTSAKVCDGCTDGHWKLESKNLETLTQ